MPRVGGPGTWVSIGAFRMCLCEVRGMCDSDKLHNWFLFFLFFSSVFHTVFVEKVLQRLFPRVPSGQGKREPQTLAVQSPPKKVTSEKVSRKHAQPLTDASSETPTARRLYTASGPPEGYVPCWPEPSSCGSPEHASSGDDTEGKMLGGRKGGHLCR